MLRGNVKLNAAFGQKKIQRSDRLQELERTITLGKQSFIDVGQALEKIRDGKLYKERGYGTFEEYCEIRWEFKKSQAYRQITASREALKLSETERPKTEREMRKSLKSQQKLNPVGDKKPPTNVVKIPKDALLEQADRLYANGRVDRNFLKHFIEWAEGLA
jgi:hypothetical protein